MHMLNRSCREALFGHLLINILNFEWLYADQQLLPKPWPHVSRQQGDVLFIGFLSNATLDRTQPVIEILVQPNLPTIRLTVGAEFIRFAV